MMVAIAAYGITEFTKKDISIEEVLLKSTKNLFDNTPQLKQNNIDTVLISTNDNSKYLGAVLSEMAGIQPKIAHSVESLCNSGTNAIIAGYSYIKSGLAETVLISGAERYDSPGQILEWDNSRGGFKHPIFWASIFSSAYKRQNHVSEEDLAVVAAKNHRNAQNNPYAISKRSYSVEEILESEKITDDLRILDCSRPCTGSASILLCAEHVSKKFTDQPIWIKGVGQKTIAAGFTKNPSYYSMQSTREAAQIAYSMAKIDPEYIDVAEIHDAFSVCEPMALESLNFTKDGKGCELVNEYYETDNRRINPRGGLIGSGHPLGATGIAQTIEITQQLQSTAGKRQIENSKIGLVHNMSAAATSSTVLILSNEF